MWANIQSSIAAADSDPLAAGNAAMDSALDPSFDYLQTIQSPHDKGVGEDGTMDQVGINANAIHDYVGNLIEGPKVGNQFFKDTGGMCRLAGTKDAKGKDKGDGPIVPRWTYTNNKLGIDDAAAVLGPSFQHAVAGSGMDGIIPGAGGDLASMNPLKIMNGLVLDGVPMCTALTCPVTDVQSGVSQGYETKFVTPQLEFNVNPCRAATEAETSTLLSLVKAQQKAAADVAAKSASSSESYANFQENLYQAPTTIEYVDPLSAISLSVAVLIFVGYVFMK